MTAAHVCFRYLTAKRAGEDDRPTEEVAEQLLRVLARRLRRTNNKLTDQIFTDVSPIGPEWASLY